MATSRDIKPLNLFMSGPRRDGQYPDYPQALLGDFGLAFKTRTPDPNNPSWYRGWGTQGFKAPEQRLWIDQVTGDFVRNWPLGEHSNVWSMGIVLWPDDTELGSPRAFLSWRWHER